MVSFFRILLLKFKVIPKQSVLSYAAIWSEIVYFKLQPTNAIAYSYLYADNRQVVKLLFFLFSRKVWTPIHQPWERLLTTWFLLHSYLGYFVGHWIESSLLLLIALIELGQTYTPYRGKRKSNYKGTEHLSRIFLYYLGLRAQIAFYFIIMLFHILTPYQVL